MVSKSFDLSLTIKDTAPAMPNGFCLLSAEQLYMAQTDEYIMMASVDTPIGLHHRTTRITALQVEAAHSLELICNGFWEDVVRHVYETVMKAVLGGDVNWPPYLMGLFEEGRWCANEVGDLFMTSTTPEGRIKARLNKRLRELSLIWKYMPVPSGYGMQALDYLLCVAGHFVAIETKAPGKRPTPRQEQTISAIQDAGGIVFIVDGDETMDACIGSLCLLLHTPARAA